MNRIFLLFLLFTITSTKAQINEIGVFLGGSNYIGEIGSGTYINPNKPAFGLIYKWNKSTRHAYRFTLTHAEIGANDLNSKAANRYNRGLSFSNTINEFSAGLEFNFFEFDLHKLENQFTPYVFTGLSYFSYNELFYLGDELKEDYKEGSLAIPMVVGIKSRLNKKFIIAAEVGLRYTFTDNLDGSNPENENLTPLAFGNINSKDWYVFSGFTITYTFGENPCFCPK